MEALTPSLLWQTLRSRAPLLSDPITVRGIFSGFNSNKEYAGKRYATLVDPNDGRSSITLRIPSPLALKLTGNEKAILTLKGVPYWDVKPEFGKAEVVLEVGEIEGIETDHIRFEETALIIEEKLSKGWRDVGEVLRKILEKGERPRIALVVGETAVVHKDIFKALGMERESYEIELLTTSFTDPKKRGELLLSLDEKGYNLIALARGGGSGLEVFDDTNLARTVLSLKTPFATALGHAQDLHLLDKIADRSFITPTEMGRFLAETARSITEHERIMNLFQKQMEEMRKQILRREEEFKKREKEWKTKERIYQIVIFIILTLMVVLFLKP